MNIFKNILFLHDYPRDSRTAGAPATSYAQGYGNRVASARALAPLGHAHGAAENRTFPPPGRAGTPAKVRCAAATCS